ncbi:MAG: hypothetical protein HOC82_00730 [Bacteroidetes bacterium]|nr:hypothetical protein [Bacteroidota bacterium]
MNPSHYTDMIRPSLDLLTSEQMKAIHSYSINILEKTGIQVESKDALRIFEKSNAVRIDNHTVFIQAELINHAIEQAPSSIDIYNKTGEHAFTLGEKQGRETFFGIGVTNSYFQDIMTGIPRPFTRNDMQVSTKLGDILDNYDTVSTLGIPSDVDARKLDLFSALDMYANTSKPLVLLISGENTIASVFDILSYLHGDISKKPFIIPYLNPITPLVLNKSTTDKMMVSIDHQLPVMFSNYCMYGGSSPVTEAGTLALLNAELLAGLVFSQVFREGSKMILGSLPSAFNMATMRSSYTPTSYLLNLAIAEMMHFYNIPHCGTSGSNNGWEAYILASADLWQNHLSSCIGKIGCAPFVGGNLDSMAFSPNSVVLSNHIIGEAKKFSRGFSLNDESVNLNEIHSVGHGGNYFTSEQTLASIMGISSEEEIWPALSLDSWEKMGRPKAENYLKDYSLNLYNQAKKESEEYADIIRKGDEYISNLPD